MKNMSGLVPEFSSTCSISGWFYKQETPASFCRNSQKKEFVTEEELSEAGLTRADWNWMIHHKG
jgi:hypothetical protein